MRECPIYIKNGKVIDTDMTNIEKILHSKKLNYQDLTEITNLYFDKKEETINIYIDLFDILKPMYSPLLQDEFRTLRSESQMNIIAETINIVGHYRHFFATRFNKYTTIVFYYSSKIDNYYTTIEPDYKKSFYNKRLLNRNPEFYILNKTLNECISVIKEYLNYIPHAYLIDTGSMDPRLFPNLMKNKDLFNNGLINADDKTIIMSNNHLALMDIDDNTLVFKNDHKNKYYINNLNIYNELGLENNIGLPSSYIKLLFTLSGYKDFDIKNVKLMKEKKAFKYLCNKYKEKGIFDINDIYEDFSIEDQKIIKNNYLLINNNSYPFNDYKKTFIKEQFIDIIDFNTLKQDTFDYFGGNSIILLDYLFDGENIGG